MKFASAYRQAVAAHRDARELLSRAVRTLAGSAGPSYEDTSDLVGRLARIGAVLATPAPGATPLSGGPVPVRVGEAAGAHGAFPVVVPLGGGLHLAVDTDARDPRVAALLRVLVLRLLATAPPGTVRVVVVDTVTLGATFLPLRALVGAGVLDPPATTDAEVTALLAAAEQHARAAQYRNPDADLRTLVVVGAAPPPGELARLAALTHAGPTARVCLLLAGHPPRTTGPPPPPLAATTRISLDDRYAYVGDPPGHPFSTDGTGLAVPVLLDGDPSAASVQGLAAHLTTATRHADALRFADLLPERRWAASARHGLRTVIGWAGHAPVTVAFDDATPHWLVGGRTGAGKTVFLLDVLYGLAARYSPTELHLHLLDFKEGVSFTEFVPTGRDPSWLPHARAVGIESDREYGVAVLRDLRRELGRRATRLKRHGVTKLADLPRDAPVPRIVAVVDEFHVLLAGNDSLAREAVTLLEELARKGRSYGVHLVLASQSTAGVEALYGKADAIFGQFPLRVALPGGSGVLDPLDPAADALPVGSAVLNTAAGAAGANTVVRFPDAHADAAELTRLRHDLWQARPAASPAPAVFRGYETAHVERDPTFLALRPGGRRPVALVGRTVDVAGSTASFSMDATPGRHLAVVGTSATGARVLRAATLSLARQHPPGSAQFLLAPLVAAADRAADELTAVLTDAGHPVAQLDPTGLRAHVTRLATAPAGPPTGRTYLVVFGVDAAGAALSRTDTGSFHSGLDDLRTLLRHAPGYGVHLLGWWRGLRRLADDLGGTHNRDDVACLVALNVPGTELALHLGTTDLAYSPRPNRALLVDRHEHRVELIVPFDGDEGAEHDGE